MKKFIAVTVSILLIFGLYTNVYAQTGKSIDEFLIPYQNVVDKLNSELGSTIYITDKEMVYNNIKDLTPEELEEKLRADWRKAINNERTLTNDSYIDSNEKLNLMNQELSQLTIEPFSVREDITQSVPIQYDSWMYLDSTVFSGSGVQGTFTYQSINGYGSKWPGNTGYHFHPTGGSATRSIDKKFCTVELTGHPQNPEGFALTVKLTASYTFSAN